MKNEARDRCYEKSLPVPEGTVSGDPLIIGGGKIPCVAAIDRQADGKATVKMGTGSFRFSVKGHEKEEKEKAIAVGDKVFLKGGVLNADSEGDLFGYAMEPVVKAKTTVIEVKLAAL